MLNPLKCSALGLCLIALVGCESQNSLVETVASVITDRSKPNRPVSETQQRASLSSLDGEPALEHQDLSPVNDDPDQFLKKSGIAVASILGAPTQIRRDGPAEVWHYQRKEEGVLCLLDVFLYGKDGGEGLETRYVDLRGDGASFAARRACLAAMIREARSNTG